MFATQAATAIANARTHRAEQHARADLAALVETSPVGVVVFDARNGRLVLLNREAKRIVESLCLPGQSAEQLLEAVTCRRADGRRIRTLINATPIQAADGAWWRRWWSPCRTCGRWRSWNGCERSSWPW